MAGLETDQVFDVCIVGAGIEGSATARYLAKRGKKTLLLEQFHLPHSRGSSHGTTRLVRFGYKDDFLVQLMPESFKIWADVEKEAGKQLIKRVGLLSIEGPPYKNISRLAANVRNVGEECQVLEADDLKRRYPMLDFPPDWHASLEPNGGFIYANQALQALQEQFVRFGGVLRDGEKVTNIVPGDIVTIQTKQGVYRAKSVIITSGPWINDVLKPLSLQLPMEVWRVVLCYWKPKDPHTYSADNGFPGFIFYGDGKIGTNHDHFYGFPVVEYPGLVKICNHTGIPIKGPESRDDDMTTNKENVNAISDFIRRYFRDIDPAPQIVEPCLYTVTPDSLFVLDRHPQFKNIIIGAGFSGHGFKMAPVVGKVLSELALGEKPSYDLHPFRVTRFKETSLKASL